MKVVSMSGTTSNFLRGIKIRTFVVSIVALTADNVLDSNYDFTESKTGYY